MRGHAWAATWYRLRATWRERRGGYLTVVLLVGLVGGVAMGAVAGARRTQSAFPTYLAATDSSDLQVQIYNVANSSGSGPSLAAAFAHLPQVEHVASAPGLLVVPLGPNGKPLPSAVNNDEVTAIGSVGGEYFSQDRVSVAQGRMADPQRADEMVATAQAAKLSGWRVGETFSFGAFTAQQANAAGFNPLTATPVVRFSDTLVGLVVFSDQVVDDDVDRFPTDILMTPALTRRLRASGAYPMYGLRLEHGARDVATVEREIIDLLPRGSVYTFHVTAVAEGQVERASKPEAIALGVFGAIAALATLIIAGLAISRTLWANAEDLDVLRALGANPLTRTLDAMLGLGAAVVLGAVGGGGRRCRAVATGAHRAGAAGRPVARARFRLDRPRHGAGAARGRPRALHGGARLPEGEPALRGASRGRRPGIGRGERGREDGAAGVGGRRAAVLARAGPWPHGGARAVRADRLGAGRDGGGGDHHVRQQPGHPRFPPRPLRMELELCHHLAVGREHPTGCRSAPRP